MRARKGILIAIVLCLMVGALVLTQSVTRSAAQTVPSPVGSYRVVQQPLSGGDYRLDSPEYRVTGASSGGAYRLQGPSSPSGGTKCCCNFLPCLAK